MKALLIEDNPGDARLVQEMLAETTPRSVDLDHVTTLEAGLLRFADGDIDIVLLDLSLPDCTGLETLHRAREHLPAVPVVVLTGDEDQDLALEALRAGAQDYLVKSRINGDALTRVIRYATERNELLMRAERQARQIEENALLFRAMVERNADSIIIVDDAGTLRFINPAAESLFGLEAGDLLGESFGFPLSTGEAMDLSIVRGSGERVAAEMRVVETQWMGTRAHLASLRDVSRRRSAEDALRTSEERFRQIAENIQEVFWIWNVTTREMVYVSPAYERIWGRSCASLYGDPAQRFLSIHVEDRERVKREFEARGTTGGFDVEYRVTRPDGTIRWIRDRGFPVLGPRGRVYRIAGIAEDVTTRRHLEEQILHAQKLESIGQLAAGIAHDFNNLLSVINGYAQLAMHKLETDHPVWDFQQQILRAGERARALTQQILAFGRKQRLEPAVVDLGELVTQNEKMLRRLLGEDVELLRVSEGMSGHVKVDPAQMEQALTNLIINARDAMAQGGTVTVETSNVDLARGYVLGFGEVPGGAYVMLSVSDNGSGMDEVTRSRIFEPFFTTKPKGVGTGLGLAMIHGFVTQSGGHVRVESTPGQGTTFRICLPRVQAVLDQPQDERLAPLRGGNEVILVAEDEEGVRDLVVQSLTDWGYRVLEAEDGEAALEICKNHGDAIHLLLTDVVMPRMSGQHLAQRALEVRPSLKIVFMSGYTDETITKYGVLPPSAVFLRKPVTPGQLVRSVREVLEVEDTD